MAERRMFAKAVVNSARFLRMPQTSRLLYYDLGIAADDVGVVEAYTVIRTTGAAEDDLRVLASKGFVRVLNEDLVSYITDWKQNNLIRADRYHKSVYCELVSQEALEQSAFNGLPTVNRWDTEVRLGKDRIVKDRLGKDNIELEADKPQKHHRFLPPTVEEVAAYCKEREANDYYATEPKAAELLCEVETFSPKIWECACGEGHLSEVFRRHGYDVLSTDLVPRGYGEGGVDFLQQNEIFHGDIITNPPYKYAQQFVEHALELVEDGHKVAMFLKLQFLEGKARRELFDKNPPKTIYVASGRLLCAKNAEFERMIAGGGSAVAYAWFVWEKGYKGKPMLEWIN